MTSGTEANGCAGYTGSGAKLRCCPSISKHQIKCLFSLLKAQIRTGKRSQTSWHTHSEWITWSAQRNKKCTKEEAGGEEGQIVAADKRTVGCIWAAKSDSYFPTLPLSLLNISNLTIFALPREESLCGFPSHSCGLRKNTQLPEDCGWAVMVPPWSVKASSTVLSPWDAKDQE